MLMKVDWLESFSFSRKVLLALDEKSCASLFACFAMSFQPPDVSNVKSVVAEPSVIV